jgi:hypothetical protein
MFRGEATISPVWRDRLAVLGGVAACAVAAKAARLLWLRAQLSFGPVLVRQYKGQWAVVTGGKQALIHIFEIILCYMWFMLLCCVGVCWGVVGRLLVAGQHMLL